ncbi:MAG TPA: hypothetical protein VK736_00115 [Candidatus Binatia bacterium]|nr:hypothetical protein [Candidatus Binatia bacterium]
MRSRRARDREIDLRGTEPTAEDEVLELTEAPPVPPPPLRLFAGLPGPLEAEYARPTYDPTSLATLWRALESL